MKVRILNAEPEGYSKEARRILQDIGEVIEEPVPQEILAVKVKGFDVLIVRLGLRVTREVFEATDQLRVVVSATTGLDHIDLEAAQEHGVAIISLKGEQEFLRTIPATAEYTWALLLVLMRRIPWAFDDVRQGGWNRNRFRSHDLRGKCLGILGLGRIGKQVACYGLAFGMEVGAHDPFLKGWIKEVRRFETLKDFLCWSEVLSVHIPLDKETQGFLNEERLRLLPKGAWVVNTSRGALLDENALVTLLQEGHIAGAAVDVLTEEQREISREQNPLLKYARRHSNLLITPHLGGATTESMSKTEAFMAEKLRQFLIGHPTIKSISHE